MRLGICDETGCVRNGAERPSRPVEPPRPAEHGRAEQAAPLVRREETPRPPVPGESLGPNHSLAGSFTKTPGSRTQHPQQP